MEDVHDSGRTSTDERGRDIAIEESTGKQIIILEVAKMQMLLYTCGVIKLDMK